MSSALRPIRAAVAAVLGLAATSLVTGPVGGATTTQLSQRYDIVATLDVASGRLDAVETLRITNRAWHGIHHVDLSVIPRALGVLEMTEPVMVGGEAAETAWTTSTNLRVRLGDRLEPGATAVIRVPFSLSVGSTGGAFTARLSRDNGVISFGQWFPLVSREHDIYGIGDSQVSYRAARIRLTLTTTTPLGRNAVACPGLKNAPADVGTEWVCEARDVRDFAFAVNPGYRLTTRTIGETEMRVYTQTVDGAATADLAQRAFTRMEELFGEYPWPDLVLAEVGAFGGFSMEFPRSIHLTREKVVDPYVVSHEVAHQWFYAQLGNDQMREPWLDEAFADFGAREVMGIAPHHCATGRPVDSEVFDWPAGPTTGGDWTGCDGYFHAVFYRGSEFLNAVRTAMGSDAFFAAMRSFIEERRHDVVTGRELLDHLDASTPADLTSVYRVYLANAGTDPALARRDRPGGGGFVTRPA